MADHVVIGVYSPQSIAAQVGALAEREGLSVSRCALNLIREALEARDCATNEPEPSDAAAAMRAKWRLS